VEVLRAGSVLAASFAANKIRRLTIDSIGHLTDTGEVLVSDSPMNIYGAPEALSGIVISFFSHSVRPFPLLGLTPVDARLLSGLGGGISGVVHPSGDRVYVRSDGGAIDVFAYNAVIGTLGSTPLCIISIVNTSVPLYGIDQMAITQDGNKLYVPQPQALVVYDAHTGHVLRSIIPPDIVEPTGVCFAPPISQ
jgi:hypothetical protein